MLLSVPSAVAFACIIMCPVLFICPAITVSSVWFVCVVGAFTTGITYCWKSPSVKLYMLMLPAIPVVFLAVVMKSWASVNVVFILYV